MTALSIALTIVHIGVCFILILVVLLQSGKAADLAGAFGGGGSQTALGSRGAATLLTKATTIAAVLFMLTSLGLALLGSRRGGSVLDETQIPAAAGAPESGPAPAAPAEEGAAPPAEDAPAPTGETAPPGSR
ncbi:MAG: preprotein translocase subunit SecG [Candidatus Polarisedimenticolia bacterium]